MVRLGAGLDGVVVARVRTVREHPGADRLRVCDVEANGETLQVVCGAPNVREGGLYPFAPVGTSLPGGVEIREATIRGQVSRGMLCSERELRLGPDASGLLELGEGVEPGSPLVDALDLDDVRLDVEVTANRGDLLSHRGMAREVAPGGEAELRLPELPGAGTVHFSLVEGPDAVEASGVRIRIDAPDACFRYLGAVIRGVRVGPSPGWLQSRLRAAGARPINNVVDATNYVLLELGQPLHAFDLDRLEGGEVVVRRARPGETIVTLDGENRELDEEMLCICDAEHPAAVAGVMGGIDSEVTEETTSVLLECALFEPKQVRSTRQDLGLSTDASYRFERGVDPAAMEVALARTVSLILATAGGELEAEVLDVRPRPWPGRTVQLRPERVEAVLGVPFDPSELAELLEPLGFELEERPGEPLSVSVPGWRSYDVTREIDLVEEVARARGYDAFPSELGSFRPGTVPDDPLFLLEDRLRDLLVSLGFLEAQVPAFAPAEEGEVALLNPISQEESHLRSSLLPGLLRRVEHNFARGVRDVRLFELGTCFFRGEAKDADAGGKAGPGGGRPREETRLAMAVSGRRSPPHWSGEEEGVDLWDVKGWLEELAGVVAPGAGVVALKGDDPVLVPERSFALKVGDETSAGAAGRGGRVRAGVVDAPPWADAVWAIEVVLPEEPETGRQDVYRPLPTFPGVARDLALVLPDSLEAGRVARAIRAAGGSYLERVEIFDLYRGEGVPEGARSVAFRLHFSSPERTLTDEEVDAATGTIVRSLEEELGVEPRG